MFFWASVLWVKGLLTAVPYAAYCLFYYAPRDEYAPLITFVLFWVFGYWGVAGPVIMMVKVRRVFRRLEAAQDAASLAASLQTKETEEVMIDSSHPRTRYPASLRRASIACSSRGSHHRPGTPLRRRRASLPAMENPP
jgi:hypothetical protein